MAPRSTHSSHCPDPVARESSASGDISTTAGGVPREWDAPSIICTAAYGGTRTSTLLPGERSRSVCKAYRTASAMSVDEVSGPPPGAANEWTAAMP